MMNRNKLKSKTICEKLNKYNRSTISCIQYLKKHCIPRKEEYGTIKSYHKIEFCYDSEFFLNIFSKCLFKIYAKIATLFLQVVFDPTVISSLKILKEALFITICFHWNSKCKISTMKSCNIGFTYPSTKTGEPFQKHSKDYFRGQ